MRESQHEEFRYHNEQHQPPQQQPLVHHHVHFHQHQIDKKLQSSLSLSPPTQPQPQPAQTDSDGPNGRTPDQPVAPMKVARPLSISSISSAASSGSSSSANSSASSGAQSSLTRNGSLNYGHHYWDSNLTTAQKVVTEIIETERTYVDDLEQIVTGYLCHLRNILKQQRHQQQVQQKQDDQQDQQDEDDEPSPQHQLEKRQSRLSTDSKEEHQVSDDSSSSPSPSKPNDEDDKSICAFDDDVNSATNEVEDYDVDETDNDLAIKENITSHHIKDPQSNLETCANDGSIITASHIKRLFSNLGNVYKFNKDLLFRLEECYLNPKSVAECFVTNAAGFEVYTHYCTMYPQVVSTLTELMANPTQAQLLRERQIELNQSLPLGAYLLKPVQRILKYHILFQSLIKHTADDETVDERDRQLINEAFSVMTGIACHINAMKKKHEHAIRVQEVQGLLEGWEGPDLTTLGELILEDTFKLFNRPKSSRHLFLFDSVLLITKKKRDGSLCYKEHIECSNLMLIENIEGQPLVFNTVPFDNPKALCAFQAKNLDKKRDWCLQMKEVMIKSFDVKIPVHVRDILMSLTTNNTNTSTSPKCSSESARLLRAPNYLEKKRAKQEERK